MSISLQNTIIVSDDKILNTNTIIMKNINFRKMFEMVVALDVDIISLYRSLQDT